MKIRKYRAVYESPALMGVIQRNFYVPGEIWQAILTGT